VYRERMLGFCRDWRALWYRHGLHRTGWPHYAHLVAETSRGLPDYDPPLQVRNGMCAAKTAFTGRVLAVALSRGVYEEFVAPVDAAATRPMATRRGAPATALRPAAAAAQLAAVMPPSSRNDPCPCGSGRRYKHCHGAA
jgi:hypothetical protein